MSRKVFLSFLGTSIYKPTFYVATGQNENEVRSTRFIQEALIDHFCKDFTQDDIIIILTTSDAHHNWDRDVHYDNNNKENVLYDGLKTRIEKLKLNATYTNLPIPDGKSTNEIWNIFQKTYNAIGNCDELIFDITHGFRSLPMLNMVLINYAKLLKNISVKGIYYGNYEARYKLGEQTYSPIWDLKDFERLQEWTNSAQLFVKAGYAERISELMKENRIQGANQINEFCQEVLTNRCIRLTEGSSSIAIKNMLTATKDEDIHPVIRPIFELIEKEFSDYDEKNVLNGLLAVKWCIAHDLIQQGYTIMSEFLPTYILNFVEEDFVNKASRGTVNGILGISGKVEKFNFTEDIKKEQIRILNKVVAMPYFKELCQRNRSINAQNRDDINHGGFRPNPKSYKDLKTELVEKFKKLKDVIDKIEKYRITHAPKSL